MGLSWGDLDSKKSGLSDNLLASVSANVDRFTAQDNISIFIFIKTVLGNINFPTLLPSKTATTTKSIASASS